MTNERKITEVYLANKRDNQIGGQTDGISPEVAEDLGYTATPEALKEVLDKTREQEAGLSAGQPPSQSTEAEEPRANPYWPTAQEREAGLTAIEEIRREHNL